LFTRTMCLWPSSIGTRVRWEGNGRFVLALAIYSGLSAYVLNGLQEGDEHPAYAP